MVIVFIIRFILYIFTFRLKQQIPDIKTSLDIVKHLQSRKVCTIININRTKHMNTTCKYETTGESEWVIFRIYMKNTPNKLKKMFVVKITTLQI